MDNSTQISEEEKNNTYTRLSDLLLLALEAGVISTEDAHDASAYILNRLDSLPSHAYLEAFLEEISERWPCFKPILHDQEETAEKIQTQENIQNIKQEINQLT